MRSRRLFYWLGGLALMLGALMFSLTKARGYVDPYDSLLGYFIFAGFTLLLLGVVALYVLYAPVSGRLGKIGLGTAVVGVVLLAVGHPFSFMFFRSLFALGWILLGYVLWSDVREIIEDPSTPGLDEAKARRSQPPISNGDRSSSYSERRRLHR